MTRSAVTDIFTTLIRDSGRTDIGVRELRGTLALARANGIEFGQAADIVAQALRGNLDPLRQLTGDQGLKTLNEAFERSIQIAPDTVTAIDQFSSGWRRAFENIAESPAFKTVLQFLTPGGVKVPDVGDVAQVSGRTQAIQQAIVNLNFEGMTVMNEDQRAMLAREIQRILDENNRRG